MQQSGGLLLPRQADGKRQIRLLTPTTAPHGGLTMHRGRIRCVAEGIFLRACPTSHSVHRLQLVDHAFDDLETLVPELGVAGIETERSEEFRMVFRPPGFQEVEVFRDEPRVRLGIETVKRIYEAIAECVGIHIERRMDEVRDVGPENLISRLEFNGRTEALRLHLEPKAIDLVGR